jgi:tRNA pseudouridine38-40 synthase
VTEKQRYFIELSFDGTNYHGWQIQQNAITVQEVLNNCLSTLLRQPVETTGCGRTDTGVHAREFFAHFEIQAADNGLAAMDEKAVIKSANAILPYDIAIKRIFVVEPDFHARFSATLRTYEYYIHFSKDPFKKGRSWEMLHDRPDIALMNQAAQLMMEYTDFSCFSRSNTQVKTNNCKISKAEWHEIENGMMFRISADRFLRNMVRAIVGTLMLVGRKEIPTEAIREIIEGKKRSNAGTSAPAHGLYLTEVKY